MKLHLRYFASFKEIIRQGAETLTVPEGATVEDVQATLLARYPQLQPVMERCRCAVNRSYVPAETVLHEQDELVFIPPIGGGR